MKKKTAIIISFILIFFTVSGYTIIHFFQQELENQWDAHLLYKQEAKPVYQQVTVQKNTSSDTERYPETDITIPSFTLSEIRNLHAGTIVMDSMLNPELIPSLFYHTEITEEIQQRILGISYKENDNISLDELRYLRVLHRGFDGETHIGELIVNKSIADDILDIMYELYQNDYPIEKMLLIDEYNGNDELSMSNNNTSAFNYRTVAYTDVLSDHSYGMAIDINPLYNPYVVEVSGSTIISPENGIEYADRSKEFPYKIDSADLCVQLFLAHGFTWGGDWNSPKDYQHFEKYY